eukprot:CAMPEP_0181196688 /NCGR_PEP_ID=MMETSP1096-20121128/15600_1 /TAXON_ID=156174 ORGANISM="Chrysochromulina ericina, Strain CCMP281" /NCGR_SAMPLE_ID=MMETSP1096 /ASSEMBLY_ACC=CAM_ASM_000453 /LENGTH=82 /DNA_ID=CAMNT_0023286467 /DNA_START=384 /DNA_END=632 /DNA_ORIENTATION=+
MRRRHVKLLGVDGAALSIPCRSITRKEARGNPTQILRLCPGPRGSRGCRLVWRGLWLRSGVWKRRLEWRRNEQLNVTIDDES